MDGFINLLKPAGMTSHDAVSAMRRILRMKKIGHTGTLDPMACGVMSICVGSGTRAAEYLESDDKAYRCELKLGIGTDTGDVWGQTIEEDYEAASRVTKEQVLTVLKSMTGVQDQYPPMYSAVRINGRHLYEYARAGQTVEVKPRTITVFDIKPLRILEEPHTVSFDVECSKGTYIRTICTEIGRKLGCPAAMSFLLRTRSGAFRLEDSVTIEDMISAITAAEGLSREDIISVKHTHPHKADLSRFITPIDTMLPDAGAIRLDDAQHKNYVNGGKIALRNADVVRQPAARAAEKYRNLFLVYDASEAFCGTALFDAEKNIFTAGKVLFR